MKKILFSAYSLEIGGIEKSLIMLLNELKKQNYEITLVLEKNAGTLKESLDPNIKIIEYKPCDIKNKIIRKMINAIKQLRFRIKYGNCFDFSACYATYSLSGALLARIASKKRALWIHGDYWKIYEGDINLIKDFFRQNHAQDFQKLIFVSEKAKDNFLQVFPEWKEKIILCHNFINQAEIIEKAKETIEKPSSKPIFTFLNVGRQSEVDKRLSRLIEACSSLKKKKYSFQVFMVGEGPDTKKYKNMVKDKKLEDVIIFLGKKANPYPYFLLADCIVLTSEYEGYPVVFTEALVLNKPILTTNVSDSKTLIQNHYGLVVDKTVKAISEGMKTMIEKGYTIEMPFSAEEYNKQVQEKLKEIIEG